VRAFVLSNDPVPRMWLSADPFFGAALANETVRSVLRSREALFGAGVFSTERFLYEAVGTLYWLRWSPGGTELVVHEQDDAFHEEESVEHFLENESSGKKAKSGAGRAEFCRLWRRGAREAPEDGASLGRRPGAVASRRV
jgi:hypothetical protein